MAKTKNTTLYPCFKSTFKCVQTFKSFIAAKEYMIVAFGNARDDQGNRHETWWIQSLKDNGRQFPVKKETINKLIDNQILKLCTEL